MIHIPSFWRDDSLRNHYSLDPPLRKQDLEGVIIFLSCGGGNYLLDYTS